MKTFLRFCAAYALVFALSGCKDIPITDETIDGVARVFMHDPQWYSVMVPDPASGALVVREVRCHYGDCPIRFFVDTARDRPISVVLHVTKSAAEVRVRGIDFHIHAAGDVEGAAWNRGKAGHGTTHVVQ